jgi:hypothetical protein
MLRTASAVLLLAALAVTVAGKQGSIPPNVALSVRVPAHRQECFYEDVNAARTKVFFHFMVTNGGNLDIDVHVYGPDSNLIWSTEREQEQRILFKSKLPGAHKFCFSNKMSTVLLKTVAFSIQVGDPSEGTQAHPVDPMEKSLIHIAEAITEVRNEQNYLTTRERLHRDTTESTNTRVMWFSVGEVALIAGIGALQIMYLKAAFEKRRNV